VKAKKTLRVINKEADGTNYPSSVACSQNRNSNMGHANIAFKVIDMLKKSELHVYTLFYMTFCNL